MNDDQLPDLASGNLESISPSEFAALVKHAPKSQIKEVMHDATTREAILGAVFSRMGSQYKGSKKVDAVIHWKITDHPTGDDDIFETVLADGECTVNDTPEHEPKVEISLDGEQFLNLASGNGSPPMMFFSGKLKLKGDVGFAASLSKLFNIPKA